MPQQKQSVRLRYNRWKKKQGEFDDCFTCQWVERECWHCGKPMVECFKGNNDRVQGKYTPTRHCAMHHPKDGKTPEWWSFGWIDEAEWRH